MDDFNCVDILKHILGDMLYEDLISKISREIVEEINLNIELTDFYNNVVNDYCFIVLAIGMSKKVEIEEFKIISNDISWNLQTNSFITRYDKFIKKVEDKKFNKINRML